MEDYRENIAPAKKEKVEVVSKEPNVEPAVIELRTYRPKFNSVEAYRLLENSTVHCADERKLLGNAGDFYVQLDKVQEFILPEEIFRKMFILNLEK